MLNIGIWLDRQKAIIVNYNKDSEHIYKIESEVEDYNIKGGSRSKTPWGPQEKVSEKTYLERRKHQLAAFFKRIVEKIKDADSIVIYGPAETKIHFKETLHKDFGEIYTKVKLVKTEDSMTDNQFKALVRDFFNVTYS